MHAHHKGSPSIKNKALAAKTAKARKMSMKASRAKAYDISAMELRYGDWSIPVDSFDKYYVNHEARKQEQTNNANLLFSYFA